MYRLRRLIAVSTSVEASISTYAAAYAVVAVLSFHMRMDMTGRHLSEVRVMAPPVKHLSCLSRHARGDGATDRMKKIVRLLPTHFCSRYKTAPVTRLVLSRLFQSLCPNRVTTNNRGKRIRSRIRDWFPDTYPVLLRTNGDDRTPN